MPYISDVEFGRLQQYADFLKEEIAKMKLSNTSGFLDKTVAVRETMVNIFEEGIQEARVHGCSAAAYAELQKQLKAIDDLYREGLLGTK